MSMIIQKAGLHTTVQDIGRYGYQQYGVVVSGAMDTVAMRIANMLVGNEQGAAGLEMTIRGPEIHFERETLIAVCGMGPAPLVEGRALPLWRTIRLPSRTCLQFGTGRTGTRSYLAVSGGIDVPKSMNSRSTYLRAGIGGYQGRPLQAGDVLPIGLPTAQGQALLRSLCGNAHEEVSLSRWSVAQQLLPRYDIEPVIRIMAGPEANMFAEADIENFFQQTYTVQVDSDRMGLRLTAERKIQPAKPKDMISSAVTYGTIQMPPDGNPIILMADRQTAGGYPRFAQVATVDLPVVAQIPLGGKIRFETIALDEAQRQYLLQEIGIRRLAIGLNRLVRS